MLPLFKVKMAKNVSEYLDPVLQSGYIGEGETVIKFEEELKYTLGCGPMPVSTNSCTSAIHLVLLALGVGPGDEVITTPMTCVATNNTIVLLGARPVWADVDHETGNIDPLSVRKLITIRTKAIIAVDWTGRSCDYYNLHKVTKGMIPIIQDAAHNPFFNQDNHGDFVCLSFGPIKHLTTGDGGAIIDYLGFQEKLRKLRWYGLDRTSSKDFRCEQDITEVGSKFHMNNINAAIGLANLPDLIPTVALHRANAFYLYSHIKKELGILPTFDVNSGYWVFPLIIQNARNSFMKYMNENGVMTSRVHARNDKHTAFNYPSPDRPGVDEFNFTQVNIPCGWWVTAIDLKYMVKLINEWKGYF